MSSNISDHYNLKPEKDLFHYTSPAGCIGVIKNLEFWATQIQYMNDSKEVQHAADIAREIISQKYSSRGSKKFKEHIGYTLDSMHGANTFIVSFSEYEDQLSQWRAYCRDGGVSIGFSGAGLVESLKLNTGFRLLKCIYDEEIQRACIGEIIEQCFSNFEEEPSDDTSVITHITSKQFYSNLLLLATSLKNESFKEEAEWRLIGGPFSYKDPRFDWRSGVEMIIPFLRYTLGETPPIVSACSGPSRQPIEAGRAMSSLIHAQPWQEKHTVRLSRTKTSFRRA